MDYGLKVYEKDKNAIVLGQGLLAGSPIPGTHRMIITGHSPQWNYFYDSTMGGATYVMLRLGVNYIHLKGKRTEPSILKINRTKEKGIFIEFVPLNVDKIWKGYKDETGYYALQQYVFDTYHEEFGACRILATGPAAKYSPSGGIGSAPIEHNEVTHVDSWAGRGGLGSQLFKQLGIAAIIYGGESFIRNEHLTSREKIDEIFFKQFGKKMIAEDMLVTTKYHYDEKFHSGGTLGVNFTKLKGELFSFNYRSVNWTEEKRVAIHKKFILDHYIRQFNEETIIPKQFKNCGEPCPVMCKKMNGKYKKDYEPYEALGPNAGIFDQRAAELANHYADSLGIDAIQIGIFVSWIMECLHEHIFSKEDFGLRTEPKFDPDNFHIVTDSMHNAKLAVEIMNLILYDEKGEVFRKGIRHAAKEIAKKYGSGAQDLAVYNAQGEDGYMIANQYWSPGMYSPMPLMGKYATSYGLPYMEPREIGRKNVERMILELYSDNGGLCRFHRKWIEEVYPELINGLYDEHIDIYAHHKKLAQKINWNNKPVFWESKRLLELMKSYLQREAQEHEGARKWLKKFENDLEKAAKEYWQEILIGQNEAFSN